MELFQTGRNALRLALAAIAVCSRVVLYIGFRASPAVSAVLGDRLRHQGGESESKQGQVPLAQYLCNAEPSIYGNHCSIDIRSSPRGKVDGNSSHIPGCTNAFERTGFDDLPFIIFEDPLGHLAFK